jgi:diguanylate cyclase (GGDEF)-like protein
VLHECDKEQVRERAVELKDAVSGIPFEPAPGVAVTLQISVGHAIYPSEGRSFEALSRRADERMYQDKSERNRRAVSGPVGANLER